MKLKKTLLKTLAFLSISILLLSNFSIVNAMENTSTNASSTQKAISYTSMNIETGIESTEIFSYEENLTTFALSNEFNGERTESYIPETIQGGVSTTSIIGGDERSIVNNTAEFPYSTVAYLEATFPNGKVKKGSAFVWYKDLALTAGHLVYSKEDGGWASTVTIWPGRKGDYCPYGSTTSKSIHICTDYFNSESSVEDWALLELNSDIGNNCGWRGIAYSDDYSCFSNQSVTVCGYAKPSTRGKLQYVGTGPVKGFNSMKLYYDVDTEDGQSGSPVWDKAGYCVGIHVHGTYTGMQWNSCSNITKDRFNFFKSKMD